MKKKVLFIDDDSSVLLISEIILKDLGYDVIVASGGTKGLELLSTDIDLVILDLMMPDIDGFDVLKHIRQDNKFKDIPVIIQTGINDDKLIMNINLHNKVYILLKPYNKTKLKEIIESIKL